MSDFDVNSVFYKNGWDAGRKDAADEIERLRELLSEAEEQVGDLIDDAAAGDPKDRVWILVPLVEWDEKDKRIEELEKESEWKAMKQLLCADYHIIPTDEIRAAWATITEMGDTLTQTEQDWYRAGIVVALGKLNIVRCKGCGGSGSKPTTIDHNMYGKPVRSNLICHDCNGRGWVKK